jgi:hypothetical protein
VALWCLGNTGECRGNRGYPGSCALKALPNVKGGARWTSGLVTGGIVAAVWSVVTTVALEK